MTVGRWVIWTPGLAVAIGAAVATAHGLYEVAVAASVPTVIAWLYPLITDGLALVAYAATARLRAGAARYAWSVVVLAAGLSGLAQAAYLAAGPVEAGEPVVAAPAVLRFGLGAWPAVAAAIVAHLLYLLAFDAPANRPAADPTAVTAADGIGRETPGLAVAPPSGRVADAEAPLPATAVQSAAAVRSGPLTAGVQPGPVDVQSFTDPTVQSDPPPGVHPSPAPAVQPDPAPGVQPPPADTAPSARSVAVVPPVEQPGRRPEASPARDRARAAAARHAARHGRLPTVSELESAAEVSRGTAAAVLKHLRDHPAPLHLITSDGDAADDPTLEESNRS